MYVLDVSADAQTTAWSPRVPGITEVFHASFTDHAYPLHTHDSWTLLIVDRGTISYELGRHARSSSTNVVTLLPPHVPHDGRSALPAGFRKRVLYLDADVWTNVGAAVDAPTLVDTSLRGRVSHLHAALSAGDELEAQSRLAFVVERIAGHLRRDVVVVGEVADARRAHRLRDLLRARVAIGLDLDEAAAILGADATHLVRTFTREFGLPPHRYLTGLRIEQARRLLLQGLPAAEVAVTVGFYDQSHLNRHFTRMLGTTPARYARDRGGPPGLGRR